MSEQRVLTCDHCGLSKPIEETMLWTAIAIAGVRSPDPMRAHLCTMCVPALAAFLPKIDREQFVALAVYERTIPLCAGERSLPQKDLVENPRYPGQVSRRYTSVRMLPTRPFKVCRIVIDGNPNDWLVGDVRIDNRSKFAQSGDVPGCVFAEGAKGADLYFPTCERELEVMAAYVGADPEGAIFSAKLTCEMQGFAPEEVAASRALDVTSPAAESA